MTVLFTMPDNKCIYAEIHTNAIFLHYYATFVLDYCWLGFTSVFCKHVLRKKKKEWLKLNLFWHPHAVVINLPGNRHCDNSIRNWGEFNYGWPTLQMNLVFRALNQNRADRVEVVIVTASKRARPCFSHLKEKQSQIIIHTEKEMN